MRKIVVAVTGASGSIYADLLIQKLKSIENQWNELAIVFSDNAKEVWSTELGNDNFDKVNLPVYNKHDFSAPFASGSGRYDTMIIIPCSMGTLGRIAAGASNDLITRAADVILKEKRKLICVAGKHPITSFIFAIWRPSHSQVALFVLLPHLFIVSLKLLKRLLQL